MINIGIFGATGYTGVELVKLINRHHHAHLVFAASETYAGQHLSDVIPCAYDTPLIKAEDAPLADVDVVFSCLPHGPSAELCASALKAGKRAIDFSADFRLRDAALYAQYYGHSHPHPELLPESVYGLPEIYRTVIVDANLVANPGCYPTSIILGALPLLELGALADPVVISDSKSGVSGAGRKPTQSTHFVEVNENLAPYNIGHVHRHVPEIEQLMNDAWVNRGPSAGIGTTTPLSVLFSPHLLPISRGMLSTLYFKLSPEAAQLDWHHLFHERYDGEPFMRVLPKGQMASIAHVNYTNHCAISVHQQTGALASTLVVVSCIDNLVK
ncbi:MAG TPA: N-acetyl-gamma-glutamyl-phosphate reductase, partial [Anaerolineae bacterium]